MRILFVALLFVGLCCRWDVVNEGMQWGQGRGCTADRPSSASGCRWTGVAGGLTLDRMDGPASEGCVPGVRLQV
jgi:hypothetical protein